MTLILSIIPFFNPLRKILDFQQLQGMQEKILQGDNQGSTPLERFGDCNDFNSNWESDLL